MDKTLEQRVAALEKSTAKLLTDRKRDTTGKVISIMLSVVLFVNIAVHSLYLMVNYLMTKLPQ